MSGFMRLWTPLRRLFHVEPGKASEGPPPTVLASAYADLLDKYHALVMATRTPAPVPLAQAAPPDLVTQAIVLRARGHASLYRQYAVFVAEQRAMGAPESQIADAILHGVELDTPPS